MVKNEENKMLLFPCPVKIYKSFKFLSVVKHAHLKKLLVEAMQQYLDFQEDEVKSLLDCF